MQITMFIIKHFKNFSNNIFFRLKLNLLKHPVVGHYLRVTIQSGTEQQKTIMAFVQPAIENSSVLP